MGEAKRKGRTLAARLAASSGCIYCAGARPVATVEHMPPRAVFLRRHRPKGLEFASCRECNEATRANDHVAALISRFGTRDPDPEGTAEFRKYLDGVNNNEAALIQEMFGPAGWRASLRLRVPAGMRPIYVGGPLVSGHMERFCAKFGFAMYAELAGAPLPQQGAVAARWYSNADAFEGNIPGDIWQLLGEPQTLRQGKFHVSEQFEYAWATTPEHTRCMFFGTFRRAFAILAFTTTDYEAFVRMRPPTKLWRPGDLAA